MDEKNKKRAFNRVLSPFHAGTVPEFEGDHNLRGHCVEVLKNERDVILASVAVPLDDSHASKIHYEEALRAHMTRIVLRERRKWKRQVSRERARESRTTDIFQQTLTALRATVEAGDTPWRALKETIGWGGGGVIVSADAMRPRGESDFFLLLKDPRPVVWLMETLRDSDDSLVGWMRAHAIYEKIAKATADILRKQNMLPPDDRFLLIALIDKLKEMGTGIERP